MSNSHFLECMGTLNNILVHIEDASAELNYASQSHEVKANSWLHKTYWTLLRSHKSISNCGSIPDSPYEIDSTNELHIDSEKLKTTPSSPSCSVQQSSQHNLDSIVAVTQQMVPRPLEDFKLPLWSENELTLHRQSVGGYLSLAKAIKKYHPDYVSLTIAGSIDPADWLTSPNNCPTFTYYDSPLPGWKREVSIRQTGRALGTLDTSYFPPLGNRRIRAKTEMASFLQSSNSPMSLLYLFNYGAVYCVCHRPLGSDSFLLECSYGRMGCHGWIHPECVGLRNMSKDELSSLESVVCPFCAHYLDGLGASGTEHLAGKRVLRTLTVPCAKRSLCWAPRDTKAGFVGQQKSSVSSAFEDSAPVSSPSQLLVQESENPHEAWGLRWTPLDKTWRSSWSSSGPTGEQTAGSIATSDVVFNSYSVNSSSYDTMTRLESIGPIAQSSASAPVGVEDGTKPSTPLTFQASTKDQNIQFGNDSTNILNVENASFKSKIDPNFHVKVEEDEEVLSDEEEEPTPLDVRYKRSMIECAVALCRPSRSKRKALEEGQGQIISEEPVLALLPLEDGTLRLGCVSEGVIPRSLHPFCISSQMCGYCFDSFPTPSVSQVDQIPILPATTGKKRKSSEPPTGINKVTQKLGVVSYEIHKECAVLMASTDVYSQVSNIQFGSLYEHEEAEDADCDLCGHAGGVLRYFHISSAKSELLPPSPDGWLAHAPCLYWLFNSGLFRPDRSLKLHELATNTDHESANSTQSSVAQKTLFDIEYGSWRCALCGFQSGVCTRCCGVGCAVRAHPLCAQLAGPPWRLSLARLANGESRNDVKVQVGMSNQTVSVAVFFCKCHSGLPLTHALRIEDRTIHGHEGVIKSTPNAIATY